MTLVHAFHRAMCLVNPRPRALDVRLNASDTSHWIEEQYHSTIRASEKLNLHDGFEDTSEVLRLEPDLMIARLNGSLPSFEKWVISHASMNELIRILIICRKERDRAQALRLHAYLCACGLDAHQSLGNYLVQVLVEVGGISNAQQIFDKMVYKYECSWNSLIYGYIQSSKLQHAFCLYDKMAKDDSVNISGHLIVTLFKYCTKLLDLARGLEIHASIYKSRLLETDPFVGSSLVDLYAKCGAVSKAQEVFGELPIRDIISWTALCAGYVDHGSNIEALNCFQQMELEGVSPDAIMFVCILKACGHMGTIDKGKEIHIKAATSGFFSKDAFLASKLIDMYAKFGLLSNAQKVFDKIPDHDTISWTALITGYSEHEHGEQALNCFEQMQAEGFCPDSITFVRVMKACGSLRVLGKLQEMHSKIVTMGNLEKETILSNMLITVYINFGLLENAREMFDKLLHRDVVSWSVLISGYAEDANAEEAIECFERMQFEGVQPNAVTYMHGLKSCSILRNIEKSQTIHTDIERKGLFEIEHVGTTLVDAYAKYGMLDAAEYVFAKLPVRDVVSWTALIAGYTEFGHSEASLLCFNQMRLEGVIPSNAAFICILKACSSLGDIDKGQNIHTELESNLMLKRDIVIGTTLIDMYSKCKDLLKAHEIFCKLQVRDVITWNSLISGCIQNGDDEEALSSYKKMHSECISPDTVTFACILRACGNAGAADKGRKVHTDIVKMGFLEIEKVSTELVNMYVKCCLLAEAWETFGEIPVHGLGAWNSLIAVFAQQGHADEVIKCLEKLKLLGISPDADTLLCILKGYSDMVSIDLEGSTPFERNLDGIIYNSLHSRSSLSAIVQELFDKLQVRDVILWTALISAYTENGEDDKAVNYLERMELEGIHPNPVTLLCSLKVWCTVGARDRCHEIHSEIERRGLLENNINISNNLVYVYAKNNNLFEAQKVFDKLQKRDAVSWTALITGYIEHGHDKTALKCLQQMQLEGISPDVVAYICCLKACGNVGAVAQAEELHIEAEKFGLLEKDSAFSAMLFFYAKCGMFDKAQEVFGNLAVRDVFSWTALQSGYHEHGFDEEALNCFEGMQFDGIAPDVVTYLCSLKSCGNIRAIEKGLEIHSRMEREGVLERDTSVRTVLIDMYAKCNAMSDAQNVFEKIPTRDAVMWTTLIGAYATHGLGEESLKCFEQMQLEGFSPNVVTYAYGLRTCASLEARYMGQEIHAVLERQGMAKDLVVCNMLVNMYAKFGSLDVAQQIFDELPSRDLITWTSLLAGYAEYGHNEEAIRCFEQMQSEDVLPDVNACIFYLKACGSMGAVDKGQDIHCKIKRIGLERDIYLGTALIDMYGKCGILSQAQEVFDRLSIQDVISWTTLIEAYAEHENGEEALHCLEQMQFEGVAPDVITLVCCLKACSSMGAIERTQKMHAEIEKRGFLGRNITLGNTLINTYAKNGLDSVAQKVFDSLSSRDIVSWNSLIGGYAQQAESEKVFCTFERMTQENVRPDPITFILLFNACTRSGLFKKSQMYFEAMSENHGIIPTIEHHHGMVNLLCHVGHLDKAMSLIRKMPSNPKLVAWHTLLGACRDCGNKELGKLAFQNALQANGSDAASYVLMSHIHAKD